MISSDEWLNQDSDTNQDLIPHAQIVRAQGLAGNSEFFVLLNVPEAFTWLDTQALGWKIAPRGADTMAQDVLTKEELSRGVVPPLLEQAEKLALDAGDALEKASKVGFGLGMLLLVPVAAWMGFEIVSMLKDKRGK